MTRKTNNTKGLGRSIQIAKKQHADRLRAQANKLAGQLGVGLATGGSVLEQTCLDELIATVELRKEAWAEETGEAEFVQDGPSLLSCLDASARERAEAAAVERRDFVSIPRRPKWNDSMSADELNALENEAFSDWRRDLAKAAQDEGLFLTPYERNLDFWRQLWRCVERSDLLVQIVDARDPDFYLCRDLSRYLHEVDSSKRLMIIVNKADFLSDELRTSWRAHFQSQGIDAVFFSGLRELRRQQKEQSSQAPQPPAVEGRGAEAAEPAVARSSGAPEKRVSIWARAKEAAEESEGESDQDREVSSKEPAGPLEPADIAVPGLDDSDSDLDDEDEEDDAEEAGRGRGPRAEDEFEGVADAGKLVEELLSRLPAGEGACGAEVPTYRGTVGFVGYPNVGKSTVINAIVGKTLVGMSRTPGKTKHIQTLELPSVGITLCDCPGLVFPSVAATKAHLVINNTVHIDDLRECFSPITLIVQKVGWKVVLDRYDCAHAVQDARARSGDHVLDDTHAFLAALAVSRQHFLRAGVPDENWAARKVLKDFVSGALLHCERPLLPRPADEALAQPGEAGTSATAEVADAAAADSAGGSDAGDGNDEQDQEDFNDLQSFLQEARGGGGGRKERGMTKRRMRQMNKQLIKGKGPVLEAAGNVGVGLAVCHRQGPRGA